MKYSKEFKIGVFVVVVLTASFFVINYLRGKDIFNKEIEIVSEYPDVAGLVESAPVFIKGFKAGKVSEVSYDSETELFKVTCSVKKEFRIPADSKMTIYAVDIMGGKGVKIDLGNSDVAVEDGGALAPAFEAGLLDGLAAGLEPLMAKVGNTLDSLSVTVSGINAMLSESNRNSIARTLAHLEKTMRDVNGIAAAVNGRSDEISAFIVNLENISLKLGSMMEKADTLVGEAGEVVATLNESDIEALVSSFQTLLQNINDPDGTVGKLLVDGSVYDSVDELLRDVDSLVKKIQENPKKYLKISVF
ncbi:MAG: MCE family protein [Bacteroidales bacterium]|nr:MCE family protein [Bacteroidales bacterium]